MKRIYCLFLLLSVGAFGQVMTITTVDGTGTNVLNFTAQFSGYTPKAGFPGQFNVNFSYEGSLAVGTSTSQGGGHPDSVQLYVANTSNIGASYSGGGTSKVGTTPFSGGGVWLIAATQVGGRYQQTIWLDDIGGAASTRKILILYFDGNFTVPFTYKNLHSVPVYVDFQQDGQDIGRMLVQPGQSIATSFPTTSSSPVQPYEQVQQVTTDAEGNLIGQNSYSSTAMGSPITPGGASTTLTGGSTDNFSINALDRGPIVWDPSQSGASLDGALFRSGVNKIVSALGSGSSSGATDMSATNAKLDQIHADLNATGGPLLDPDFTEPGSADSSHVTASPVLALPVKVLPSAPSIVKPGSVSSFSGSFTFMAYSFDCSFDLARFATPIAIEKGLVRAALGLWFYFLVLKAGRDSLAG